MAAAGLDRDRCPLRAGCDWEGATDVVGADFAAENVVCLHLGGRREAGLESAGGLVLSWGDWRECGVLDVDEV